MNKTLAKSIVATGGLTGLGLALQPLLADPDLRYIAHAGAECLLITGTVAGCVVVAGVAIHQLATWERDLPPTAQSLLPAQFAKSVEAVRLMRDELRNRQEAQAYDVYDTTESWRAGVIRFAFFANSNGWGWRDLAPHMNRDDWKRCTQLLAEAGIITLARGNRPTAWAAGWTYPEFRMSIKHRGLDLPYPSKEIAPHIEWTRDVTHWHAQNTHIAHTAHTTQEAQ